MANSKQDSHNKQPKYQGEAILLESRVEEIERQQQEEKKSDKAHKDRQLTFNKWLVIYTGGLLLAAVIANAVSIYQGIQMRQATRAAERAAKAAEDSIGIAQQTAKDTVTALNIAQEQVDAAKRSARTAEITAATGVKQLELFGASQRPSMGVYAVDFIHINDGGNPPKNTCAKIRIELRNSGPVPASNFVHDWNVTIGDELVKGTRIPDRPQTINPDVPIFLEGDVGTITYPVVVSGEKTLAMELNFRYEGPAARYEHCERYQFNPDKSRFVGLGASCRHPANYTQ